MIRQTAMLLKTIENLSQVHSSFKSSAPVKKRKKEKEKKRKRREKKGKKGKKKRERA